MLEYEDGHESFYQRSYYEGYCEGLLSEEAESMIYIYDNLKKNPEMKEKLQGLVPEDLFQYLTEFCEEHAGWSQKKQAEAVMKESEFLLSYSAYCDAGNLRDRDQGSLSETVQKGSGS